MDTNKYEEALKQYNTALNDEAVKAKVERIISERLAENRTPETMKFLFNSIELTSLSCTDSDESILKMVEKVNSFDADHTDLGHVAAICVYPNFAKIVADSLEVYQVLSLLHRHSKRLRLPRQPLLLRTEQQKSTLFCLLVSSWLVIMRVLPTQFLN